MTAVGGCCKRACATFLDHQHISTKSLLGKPGAAHLWVLPELHLVLPALVGRCAAGHQGALGALLDLRLNLHCLPVSRPIPAIHTSLISHSHGCAIAVADCHIAGFQHCQGLGARTSENACLEPIRLHQAILFKPSGAVSKRCAPVLQIAGRADTLELDRMLPFSSER